MIEKKFVEALKIISHRLTKEHISWALVGSTNMAFQGIDVNPHDLDIVMALKDLKSMPALLSDYNPSELTTLTPIGNERLAAEVKVHIHGVEVQFFADNDSAVYVSKLLAHKLVNLKIENTDIPCFTLEAESQAYSETNRKEKADKIKKFIEKS